MDRAHKKGWWLGPAVTAIPPVTGLRRRALGLESYQRAIPEGLAFVVGCSDPGAEKSFWWPGQARLGLRNGIEPTVLRPSRALPFHPQIGRANRSISNG